MDYYQNTSNSDMTSTTPNAHDYAQLASIYSHTDAAAIAPSLLSASISSAYGYLSFTGDVETMGEEIFRTPDGRGRVFILSFGSHDDPDHVHLLTHVYMAGPNNPTNDEFERQNPWLRNSN